MMTEEERIEKRREHNRRYLEDNRASINARIRAKKLRDKGGEDLRLLHQLKMLKVLTSLGNLNQCTRMCIFKH